MKRQIDRQMDGQQQQRQRGQPHRHQTSRDGRGGGGPRGRGRHHHRNGRPGRGRGRGHSCGRGRGRGQYPPTIGSTRTVTSRIINAPGLPQMINVTYTNDWSVVGTWLKDNNLVRPQQQSSDNKHNSPMLLGLDVETRPRYTSEDAANYRGPDVLQLGLVSGNCLVIHLKYAPPDTDSVGRRHLQEVLAAPKILKIGVSIESDVLDLWATFGLLTKGRFDMWDHWLKDDFDQRKQQHEMAEQARVIADQKAQDRDKQENKQTTQQAFKGNIPNFESLLGKAPTAALHEWTQKNRKTSPLYATLPGQGRNEYVVKVTIDGYGVIASGQGIGATSAKLDASKKALLTLIPGINFYDDTNTVSTVPGVVGVAKRPFVDPVFKDGYGLKGIVERLVPGLQHPKRKNLQMSNWSLPILSDEQILYAAMDAYVSVAAVDFVSHQQQKMDHQFRNVVSPLDLVAFIEDRILSEVDVDVLEKQRQRRKQERITQKAVQASSNTTIVQS